MRATAGTHRVIGLRQPAGGRDVDDKQHLALIVGKGLHIAGLVLQKAWERERAPRLALGTIVMHANKLLQAWNRTRARFRMRERPAHGRCLIAATGGWAPWLTPTGVGHHSTALYLLYFTGLGGVLRPLPVCLQ